MKKFLKRIWESWKKIALRIARFQTNILLTLFYFLVLAPFGLLLRLFGWNPLESRQKDFQKSSNWKSVDQTEPDLEAMRRQS